VRLESKTGYERERGRVERGAMLLLTSRILGRRIRSEEEKEIAHRRVGVTFDTENEAGCLCAGVAELLYSGLSLATVLATTICQSPSNPIQALAQS
jgi:hypothetical protein